MILFIKTTVTAAELADRYNLTFPDKDQFTPREIICGDDNPLCPIISEKDPGKILMIHWGINLQQLDKSTTTNALILPIMPFETTQDLDFPKGFQRCVIPVNGFYGHSIDKRGEFSQYLISLEDDSVFFLAGMCGTFFDPLSKQTYDFFVILTKVTYAFMPLLCDIYRMPIVLKNPKQWLDHGEPELIDDFKVEYIEPDKALAMFITPEDDSDGMFPRSEEAPKKRA